MGVQEEKCRGAGRNCLQKILLESIRKLMKNMKKERGARSPT